MIYWSGPAQQSGLTRIVLVEIDGRAFLGVERPGVQAPRPLGSCSWQLDSRMMQKWTARANADGQVPKRISEQRIPCMPIDVVDQGTAKSQYYRGIAE